MGFLRFHLLSRQIRSILSHCKYHLGLKIILFSLSIHLAFFSPTNRILVWSIKCQKIVRNHSFSESQFPKVLTWTWLLPLLLFCLNNSQKPTDIQFIMIYSKMERTTNPHNWKKNTKKTPKQKNYWSIIKIFAN